MDNLWVFDIEGDSLTPKKIWTLAAAGPDGKFQSSNYEEMKEFLLKAEWLVGHNIILFDIPVLERILNIKIKAKLIDTLALSWYLYPQENRHGLEEWGEKLGVQKPPIVRWDDPALLPEYKHRCREDVKINTKLWKKQWRLLQSIYGSEQAALKFIEYLTFKMDCAREQERSRWKLDIDRAQKGLDELTVKIDEVMDKLVKAMPKVPKKVKKSKPAKPFKKDGTYSTFGSAWFKLLREQGLPPEYDGEVELVVDWVDGNPNSSAQVKDWLYSFGWEPITFKYDRNKETGELRKIPQINLEHGAGICPSVKKLFAKNADFQLLEGLGVVSHRASILKGFLEAVDDDGYIQAQINGFTNTLRFKHKTVVNLPKVGKYFGDVIRGCLTAPEGYELCGSDMSSLEDRLKQHYIYPHDPEFVKEMLSDDYDPHLSLALLAGEITEEQMAKYKSGEDKSIKPIRDIFKNGNYACQYGAGPPRLALTSDLPLAKAEFVHATYWKKNWAIKVVADEQTVKTISGQMWLQNPINGFWYSLRYKKDIFSTLVQGSASYVFDLWVMKFREKRNQLTGQFHDEVVLCIKIGNQDKARKLLSDAIDEVNAEIKLNRELAIDIQFGERYSDIH